MDSPTDIKDIRSKIISLNDQIKLRLSVPINQRTDKQAIKLDNLCYELNCLIDKYNFNIKNTEINKN
jgi:hypothetical protein